MHEAGLSATRGAHHSNEPVVRDGIEQFLHLVVPAEEVESIRFVEGSQSLVGVAWFSYDDPTVTEGCAESVEEFRGTSVPL
jgi:hypothetical protein